jgi:membrane-associated protein
MADWIHDLKDWINPDKLIEIGGLTILLAVIFAETGLFFGFFLPGDSLLFVAGLTVGSKPELLGISIVPLILLVAAAAILGNFVGYYFGYVLGPRLFRRDDSWIFKRKYLDMTQSFYDRYGKAALILGRFLPIVRTFVPILAGAIKLNFNRFALYNVMGAALWVPSLIILGYWLGSYEWVKNNIEIIVITLIIVTIIPVIRTYIRERRRHARERAAAHDKIKIKDEAEV